MESKLETTPGPLAEEPLARWHMNAYFKSSLDDSLGDFWIGVNSLWDTFEEAQRWQGGVCCSGGGCRQRAPSSAKADHEI